MVSRRTKWLAIAAVYGLASAFLLVLIATESDASRRTQAIEAALFVGLPAVAFVCAAAPLWRESKSRLWLAAGGIVAFVVAVPLAFVTWGIALPVSCALVAIAIADFDRVLALSGFRKSRRGVAFAVVLLVGGALIGLATPTAAVVAVVGVGLLVRKLVATRPRRPADGS
jgi:hypothetical protein